MMWNCLIFLTIKYLLSILSALCFLISCEHEKYPGYTETENGIIFRLHNIGDGNIKTNYYDYITVDLVYETMDDSVFFEARRKVQITEPEFE
ncbi:MAG: hypothetical protein ABIJ16_00875, partial [Bacteroidota bacterium]